MPDSKPVDRFGCPLVEPNRSSASYAPDKPCMYCLTMKPLDGTEPFDWCTQMHTWRQRSIGKKYTAGSDMLTFVIVLLYIAGVDYFATALDVPRKAYRTAKTRVGAVICGSACLAVATWVLVAS